MGYLSLFITGFIAATLLPASSELLLLALYQQGGLVWALWLSATLGNTLGSCVNWFLGREVLRFQHKRWFPVTPGQLQRAGSYSADSPMTFSKLTSDMDGTWLGNEFSVTVPALPASSPADAAIFMTICEADAEFPSF